MGRPDGTASALLLFFHKSHKGIIYGGKIVETGRLDLKRPKNANLAFFRSFLGSKFGTIPSGEGQNLIIQHSAEEPLPRCVG